MKSTKLLIQIHYKFSHMLLNLHNKYSTFFCQLFFLQFISIFFFCKIYWWDLLSKTKVFVLKRHFIIFYIFKTTLKENDM